jgi:hypothetical protein
MASRPRSWPIRYLESAVNYDQYPRGVTLHWEIPEGRSFAYQRRRLYARMSVEEAKRLITELTERVKEAKGDDPEAFVSARALVRERLTDHWLNDLLGFDAIELNRTPGTCAETVRRVRARLVELLAPLLEEGPAQ